MANPKKPASSSIIASTKSSTRIVHSEANPPKVPGITFTEPSLTKQQFADECDINNIIDRFEQTGQLPAGTNREPQYGYAPATDFREAMEIVTKAKENFDRLPAQIRARFGNSPENFLQFAENPANLPEMVAMGLAEQTAAPGPNQEERPAQATTDPDTGSEPPRAEQNPSVNDGAEQPS